MRLYLLVYLGLAGAVAAAALRDLRKTDRAQPLTALRRDLTAMVAVTLVATMLIIPVGFGVVPYTLPSDAGGSDGFALIRLWAWQVFGLTPVVLLTMAWMNRRIRWLAGLEAVVAAGILAIGVDAFLIEPYALEVNHHTVSAPDLSRSYTIALLADIQTDDVGAHERGALKAVMAAEPDLILFAGDYIQAYPSERPAQIQALQHLLTEVGVSAPLGVYAVQGNVEQGWDWETTFGDGVTVFSETGTIALNQELSLTGLTLADSDQGSPMAHPGGYHIVLGHKPDFALHGHQGDLLVAGHTHGGQVQLPVVGPLLTLTDVPKAWAAGVTALADGATLVVSRGIGMERSQAPRLRFLCKPEVIILTLTPLY